MKSPRVLVVGGGIGGLCAAHGLRSAGIDVAVAERDAHPGGRWEGYRIHIDPAGARSLQACLPEHLWKAFLDTSAPGGDFGFLTETLAQLVVVEEEITHPAAREPTADHYSVDRRVLRRLLLAGLDDVVTLGAEFHHYEHTDGGGVAAVFADGRRVVADVLVGADGVGSRVRRQYLPAAEPQPAGVVGFGHKLFLTDETRSWVPPQLQQGMNLISGRDPVSLFTSAYRPPPGTRAALARVSDDVPPDVDDPYILCALVTESARLPADLDAFDSDALQSLVDRLIDGWHPRLRRLLADSDPASRGAGRFTVSPQLPPWPSGRVTLLGDAIHTMPATGGLGGNTALRDARRLAQALAASTDRGQDPVTGIATYEADLRDHGYAALREALKVRDRMLAHGALSTLAARTWFRLCRRSSVLRRQTFADPPDALSTPRTWEHPAA